MAGDELHRAHELMEWPLKHGSSVEGPIRVRKDASWNEDEQEMGSEFGVGTVAQTSEQTTVSLHWRSSGCETRKEQSVSRDELDDNENEGRGPSRKRRRPSDEAAHQVDVLLRQHRRSVFRGRAAVLKG